MKDQFTLTFLLVGAFSMPKLVQEGEISEKRCAEAKASMVRTFDMSIIEEYNPSMTGVKEILKPSVSTKTACKIAWNKATFLDKVRVFASDFATTINGVKGYSINI